jgi:hypothetical protein
MPFTAIAASKKRHFRPGRIEKHGRQPRRAASNFAQPGLQQPIAKKAAVKIIVIS